jgi:hypothetical protein
MTDTIAAAVVRESRKAIGMKRIAFRAPMIREVPAASS